MERTYWVVEYWEPRYAYWRTLVNPASVADRFAIPRVDYDTEEAGLARLDTLRANNPEGQYQLVKVHTITEVVA